MRSECFKRFSQRTGAEIECIAALCANSCTKPISACIDNGVEEPDSNIYLPFVAGSSTLPVSIRAGNLGRPNVWDG